MKHDYNPAAALRDRTMAAPPRENGHPNKARGAAMQRNRVLSPRPPASSSNRRKPKPDFSTIDTYALVPRAVALNRSITRRALQLYILLLCHDLPDHGVRKGYVFPSERALSEEFGVGVRRIKTLLRELETLGWIETEYDGRRATRHLMVRVDG